MVKPAKCDPLSLFSVSVSSSLNADKVLDETLKSEVNLVVPVWHFDQSQIYREGSLLSEFLVRGFNRSKLMGDTADFSGQQPPWFSLNVKAGDVDDHRMGWYKERNFIYLPVARGTRSILTCFGLKRNFWGGVRDYVIPFDWEVWLCLLALSVGIVIAVEILFRCRDMTYPDHLKPPRGFPLLPHHFSNFPLHGCGLEQRLRE